MGWSKPLPWILHCVQNDPRLFFVVILREPLSLCCHSEGAKRPKDPVKKRQNTISSTDSPLPWILHCVQNDPWLFFVVILREPLSLCCHSEGAKRPKDPVKIIRRKKYNCFHFLNHYQLKLICQDDGKEKLRICCTYRSNGEVKRKLGFLIRQPKSFSAITPFTTALSALFVGKVVITPKPGLFPPK